jgi:hypothetical protein
VRQPDGGVAGDVMPEIHERVSEYTVCALPEGHREYWHFAVTVNLRGDGRWTVANCGYVLSADGTWAPETSDSDRFDLDTALRLAREAAPHVTVSGWTRTAVLARDGRSA